jgi:cytochrome c oxidase subunit I
MMIGLTIVNYGFPIAQLAALEDASVPVIPIGSRW